MFLVCVSTPEYGTRFEILGVRADVSLPDMRTSKGGSWDLLPLEDFEKYSLKNAIPRVLV